ncbi:MAG: MFS transporter [Thermomicrobiales bacterium]
MFGFRNLTTVEARRGFWMLLIATLSVGMAMAIQQNIVTNYFRDELGLEGSQFGYITAIREIPGFLLIFVTALFYRLSLPKLTALAFVTLAVGYMFFGLSVSMWTVAPWVVLSSMGYHTIHQTKFALGMSLTTEGNSGRILGAFTALNNVGALVAMVLVMLVFYFDLISFRPMFVIAGALALVGAFAIFGFPNLRDGEEDTAVAERPKMVYRKPYRFYYYLNLLDGGRQQIFFSFGLFVLVDAYGMSVAEISALLIGVRLIGIFSSSWIGGMIDRHGERAMLGFVNFGYIFALAGYALVNNVYLASACYLVYAFIMPLSQLGSATYLRKVAIRDEIAPSLAMGVTLQHAAAIVVPISAGFILNFVGYQVAFLIACVFASFTILVTRRLDPASQRSPARIAEDERIRARLAMPTGSVALDPADG